MKQILLSPAFQPGPLPFLETHETKDSDATLGTKMTYDVVVIGSGPGGYSAAVRAGQYGEGFIITCTAIMKADDV